MNKTKPNKKSNRALFIVETNIGVNVVVYALTLVDSDDGVVVW
jgi:hypothetical protein